MATCTDKTLCEETQAEGSHLQVKKRSLETFPHSPQKEPILLIPPWQTSSLQNCETVNVYCLNHYSYMVLSYNSPSKLIH